MQTESTEYEITLSPRGPHSCEWKVWPKGGGVAKANGVEKSRFDAEKAAQRAKERLEAKRG